MEFHIIDDKNGFLTYIESWSELYKKTALLPFSSFEWNYEWYIKAYKTQSPFIIIAYESSWETPLAICPFMLDSKGCLRFIADAHSDYSDFLIAPEIKSHKYYEIMKTIVEAVAKSSKVKTVELKNISQSNKHIAFFSSLLDYKKIIFQSNALSFKKMGAKKSFFENFDYLSSKQRSELKRLYKKHSGFECVIFSTGTHKFPKDEIEEIVKEMVSSNLRDKNFLNGTLLGVIESLYNEGVMIISSLIDKEKKIYSMNFILKNKDKSVYLFWIDIYRNLPYLNLSAYLYFIEWLTLNKKESFTIDFGRGLYDYKIKNFLPDIELQFTLFYAKNNLGFIKYLIKLSLLSSVKNFYKKNKSLINRILKR